MAKKSAGILIFRRSGQVLEVLLVHPGGPFWAKKDLGAWSVPKGEPDEGEDLLVAAIRELQEETGLQVSGDFIGLNPQRQKSGKIVYAWAIEEDVDISEIKSNDFEMEWPPHSGKKSSFPEIDKAGWFDTEEAKKKIIEGQIGFIEELESIITNK